MDNRVFKSRLKLVAFFLILSLFVLLIRLSYVQIKKSPYLKERARNQHLEFIKIEPIRGIVYDRNMKELAVNLKVDSLYCVPGEVKNREEVSRQLSSILGIKRKTIREKLTRKKMFVWIARKISEEAASRIKELNFQGIYFVKENKRFYPKGRLASQTIGFTDLDSRGIEGIELFYDTYLKGVGGGYTVVRDAKGRELSSLRHDWTPSQNGYNLILSIDEIIQHIAEKELHQAAIKHNARAGTIVVMNPNSGEILALANYPAFDSNHINDYDVALRRNRAISDIFEPGSVFKIVTASAALQEGRMQLEDKIYCEEGSYRVVRHTLHDHKPYGWLTFPQVFIHSSNIGTVKIAQELGEDELYRYIKLFGFGTKTGIDLPGEVRGIVRDTSSWSKLSIAAIPIGHEVAVTSLQLACAISAIANDGVLLKPFVVKYIQDSNNNITKFSQPQVQRRVISASTAQKIKQILIDVVEKGTGRRAKIKGYRVAGKTGTAQKVAPSGGYSRTKFISSFIGFVPADKPAIAVVVVIDEPHPLYYGGLVAAPVFQRVAEGVLRYLKVSETTTYESLEDNVSRVTELALHPDAP